MATLEEAIAGKRRGERWKHNEGELAIRNGGILVVQDGGMWSYPLLDGWTRIVEEVSCPLCNGKGKVEKGQDYYCFRGGATLNYFRT